MAIPADSPAERHIVHHKSLLSAVTETDEPEESQDKPEPEPEPPSKSQPEHRPQLQFSTMAHNEAAFIMDVKRSEGVHVEMYSKIEGFPVGGWAN
ncbi:Uu.00g070080.m01.CDS01 [Anthostomella pinea]|uniref:Uu.00g070080.m01.CDS01 n=1 Tax=Anthostomella pinea TaxID=933095 RepID=A0AAI8VVU6_9PEZI|nr:Uu.00g070080.m01.CDS01 [Anthostomella pinea]